MARTNRYFGNKEFGVFVDRVVREFGKERSRIEIVTLACGSHRDGWPEVTFSLKSQAKPTSQFKAVAVYSQPCVHKVCEDCYRVDDSHTGRGAKEHVNRLKEALSSVLDGRVTLRGPVFEGKMYVLKLK